MTDTITINDRAGFQATIAKLTELTNGIAAKVQAGSGFLDAADKAASNGVVTSGNGSKAAPAYTSFVEAEESAVSNITAQATTAGTAAQAAITDLTSLLNGLTQIDDSAAAAVHST